MQPHCSKCEYIIDIYFVNEITHLWTKSPDGSTNHYQLWYHPKIYIATDMDYDVTNGRRVCHNRTLKDIAQDVRTMVDSVFSIKKVKRILDNFQEQPVEVLEVRLMSYDVLTETAEFLLERNINVFNCDINRREHFFIEEECTPMTAVHIETDDQHMPFLTHNDYEYIYFSDAFLPDGAVSLESITTYDDVSRINYFLPRLKIFSPKMIIDKQDVFPSQTDRLKRIKLTITNLYGNEPDNSRAINLEGDEDFIIKQFQQLILAKDPDILDIAEGDKFYLDYLAYRAEQHGIRLYLDRLKRPYYRREQQEGQTYHTYGQIMRREAVKYLAGRLHIDIENSFFLAESGLDGLIDLSRISGLPPIRASRASIGTVLTGVELIINHSSDPPTLVPPDKSQGEYFKKADKLLIADNGGLIYPAQPGVHDRVWAVDFTSLYPFIMLNHNIGNETILCEHESCKYDDPILVPEVKYHTCKKREAVVKRTMELVLEKRVKLKTMKKELTGEERDRIAGIDSAYKWILVSCFGYLGFKNARWGSIESHQSVTAYGRVFLKDAMQIAKEMGFDVIAGITDSLFIRAKDIKDDTRETVEQLANRVSNEIDIPLDIEGKFRWIVFGSVKEYNSVAALNRYFGYFDHEEFKLRGIRHRQRRVTKFEKEFQEELLELFSEATNKQEYHELLPASFDILKTYMEKLRNHEVNPRDLIMKLKSTRGTDGYKATNTVQALATKRYDHLGSTIKAGMNFKFIVHDDSERSIDRVRIGPEIDEHTTYDPEYYIKLLDADYLEITKDAQIQAYDSIRYDTNGVTRRLDDYVEEGCKGSFIDNIPSKLVKKKDMSLDDFF